MEDELYMNLSKEQATNLLSFDFKEYKTEVVSGQFIQAGERTRVDAAVPSLVPISVVNANKVDLRAQYSAQVEVDGETHDLKDIAALRNYYLPIDAAKPVFISSKHDLMVGRPMALVQQSPNPVRLSLVLFVDSFFWGAFTEKERAVYFPNIHRFFSHGMVFEQCYATSNWTVPSLASVVTGQTVSAHKRYHPQKHDMNGFDGATLGTTFHDCGFFTFQACGIWGRSPGHGYARGFDRSIFKNQLSIPEAFNSFYEQVRAFDQRNHFVWLSVFDAHHHIGYTPSLETQKVMPLRAHSYQRLQAKAGRNNEVNDTKFMRYREEFKWIDFQLGQLFDFIEANYRDDELAIGLFSDHGVSYATEDPNMLSRERTHVSFMFRGRGIPAGTSDEMVQITDLYPTLAKIAGISYDEARFGRVPEALGGPKARRYAYTENLYPGQPYTIAVRDAEYTFYLETCQPTPESGAFELEPYTTVLYRYDDFSTDLSDTEPDRAQDMEGAALAFVRNGGVPDTP